MSVEESRPNYKGMGLYNRYKVDRIDGGKDFKVHNGAVLEKADYFVLHLNSGNEPELIALEAYADAVCESHPKLARDIYQKIVNLRKRYSTFNRKGIN